MMKDTYCLPKFEGGKPRKKIPRYPVVSAEEEGLSDWFKLNPHVTGMAIGAGANGIGGPRRIVHNPYSNIITDAQRFVHEYNRKKFKNKLKNLSDDPQDLYDANEMRYLQLQEVSSDLNFKNNAAFAGDKFIYNGMVTDKYFPTFADVMAHEAGHQLDRNFFVNFSGKYGKPSYVYKPFIENNKDLYNVHKYSKYADEIINSVVNDDARAYSLYHDAYPSEVFADLISDKYRMNVNNIYNSLGNTPFTENDYEAYKNYLNTTTDFPWSRGMYQLIKPGENYNLPDKQVYTKAMNDL